MLEKRGNSYYLDGEVVLPKFQNYTRYEDYENEVKYIEPMTAKEVKPELVEKMLKPNSGYLAEEKFDGTRAILHLLRGSSNRIFSRRVSVKTGWFVENTDLLPHIREIRHDLDGTILDGELTIPDRPFIDASSTMNCKWEKALDRQIDLGMIVLNAFDILYYKGKDLRKLPLIERKHWLDKVIEELNSPYIRRVPSFDNFISIGGVGYTKEQYYNYIVDNGGEGLILKDKNGIYEEGKRSNAYIKLKKHSTWDCVITGFSEPTREYLNATGKNSWGYWEDSNGKIIEKEMSFSEAFRRNLDAVTKFYAKDWIGAIEFGVYKPVDLGELQEEYGEGVEVMIDNAEIIFKKVKGKEAQAFILEKVGECSGMGEKTRAEISANKFDYLGKVIEVKAQEVIKKTGALRHPQFAVFRDDKKPEDCTWDAHLRG